MLVVVEMRRRVVGENMSFRAIMRSEIDSDGVASGSSSSEETSDSTREVSQCEEYKSEDTLPVSVKSSSSKSFSFVVTKASSSTSSRRTILAVVKGS